MSSPSFLLSVSLPVLLLACSPGSGSNGDADSDGDGGSDADGDGGSDGGDDGGPDSAGFVVDITLSSHVSTVPVITWELDDGAVPSAAWIEVDDLTVPVDLSAGGPWQKAVLGLKPEQSYDLRIVAELDGETLTSASHGFETGSVSNQLPDPDVELIDAAGHADGYLVTSLYSSPPAAIILDSDGEYVWWHIEDSNNFQVSRAWLSNDRSEVLYWTENVRSGGAAQELVRIAADGQELDRISLPDGHHDFHQLDDGRVAFLEYDQRGSTQGDRVSVIDLDTRKSEVIWSAWDDIPENTPSTAGGGEGWSHANSIQSDGTDLYVTFLGFEGIGKVNVAAGALEWVMGGVLSDFATASGSTDLLSRPHNFQVLDGSLLCFDNGEQSRRSSRVLEYALNEGTGEAELIWSYTPSPDVYTFSLGDTHRLSTGQTIMNVSAAGQIDEASPEGELVWRLELGEELGYSRWIEDLY